MYEIKKAGAKFTSYVLIGICCFSFFSEDFWKGWRNPEEMFRVDNAISYWYVPATFIYHDYKAGQARNIFVWPDSAGRMIPKYTYGMSVMYAPFFFAGHKFASNAGEQTDGYSLGYANAINYGCIIYGMLGLFFLSRVLLKFFSDNITAITLVLIFLGTNFFTYSVIESARVHQSLFFLISLFIWLTIKWHENPDLKKGFFIGLLLGLITMVRATDIIIVAFFLLYDVRETRKTAEKIKFFFSNWGALLMMCGGFIIMLLPQLIFWKIYAGEFFHYTYGKEKFFWTDPAILNFMVSYRNGWLVYTPIMVFALVGFFFLKQSAPPARLSTIIYTILSVYVLSCWWCWWYMGFGNRSMIQSYPVLALGLASFIQYVSKLDLKFVRAGKYFQFCVALCFSLFICLNLLQSYQYKYYIIHYEGMNRKTYWQAFCKVYFSPEETEMLSKNLTQVNWEEAKQGKGRSMLFPD